jgi:TonB family protein
MALAFAWLGSARFARAGEVRPPSLLEDRGVTYPRRALDERFYERVEVVVVVEVDRAGRVVDAAVEGPVGHGFDEAAIEAARRLRFEPATREGIAVAARIAYRYVFDPPPALLSGRVVDGASGAPWPGADVSVLLGDGRTLRHVTDPGGWFRAIDLPRGTAAIIVHGALGAVQNANVELVPGEEARIELRMSPAAQDPPADAPRAIEVTVQGERLAPAASSYTRAEVRQIPGAFGDPFRAIETLPGVTPVASGLPFFYVRGAPPGNVGYFLDGIRVPYLFHIGLGPSVIHPAIVDRVDLHPGGYPARFGRFGGGIVAAETTGPRPDFHGEGNLRLFDVGALVESGFAEGRGTALVGGRYSYTAALLSLVAPQVRLDYRDYQARITYDLTPRDRIGVFGFGAFDLLAQEKRGISNVLFGSEFYRADPRYDHTYDGGAVRTAVTLGYDRSSAAFIATERRNVVDRSVRGRVELRHAMGQHLLRAGADAGIDAYHVEPPRYADPESPETQRFDRLFPSRRDFATGAFVDCAFRLGSRAEITPGLRVDLYGSGATTAIGFDPRLAGRFEIAPAVRLVHALGMAHQAPSFALPVPGITPAQLSGGLQRSVQSSAGAEIDLDEATMLRATLFHNAFFAMSDAIGTSSGDGPPDFEARGRGSAYGAEIHLKRRLTRRIGGFLSYTLSRSTRTASGRTFPSAFDRTHVAQAALAYDLGRAWRAGARLVFYTGAPNPTDTGRSGATGPLSSDERADPFVRLDLRLEKRWLLGETRWISFVAEIMNATLSRETFGGEPVGPIVIPSIGAEVGF